MQRFGGKNTENSSSDELSCKKKQHHFEHWHIIALYLMVYDFIACGGSYFLALWIRYDCRFSMIPEQYFNAWLGFTPLYSALCILVFWIFRLYNSLWQYASYTELKRTLLASAFLSLLHSAVVYFMLDGMPASYYIIGAVGQFMLVLSVRFAYRFLTLERAKKARMHKKNIASRIMLIGAGSAGQMILRDLNNAPELNDYVCCIIDDDRNKLGCFIDGVPIVGDRNDILFNVQKYKIEKIYLAIPSATAEQRRNILDICKETSCELKNLPGMYQFVTGKISASSMKEVAVEDLLGRETVTVDMEEIFRFIKDKTILVTGGGGSIGSELCRQIAQHQPKKLIAFDIYENNAYSIGIEIKEKYPGVDFEVLIGSVRDSKCLNQLFSKYHPDIVYHAAAHKHVPLMEDSPCEAIKNNAVGTYKTAYAAMLHGCKRFVLISTDKAVNPTNVMGASKRICEMIIQSFDRKIRDGKTDELPALHCHMSDDDGTPDNINLLERPQTEFVAVRFGNVLGSNGSVIPLFKKQIARGGPVTVTHPDIIRYFMTIPEAASLVLQAGTYAKGGEIFVLDMGSPVKIDTLARNLIRLSGLQPDVDIKISYTGLRAGEKLYEEKLMSEEGLKTTPNKLIHIGSPIPFNENEFLKQLKLLMEVAYDGQASELRRLIAEVVPTYRPAGEHGRAEKDDVFRAQMEIVKAAEEKNLAFSK